MTWPPDFSTLSDRLDAAEVERAQSPAEQLKRWFSIIAGELHFSPAESSREVQLHAWYDRVREQQERRRAECNGLVLQMYNAGYDVAGLSTARPVIRQALRRVVGHVARRAMGHA